MPQLNMLYPHENHEGVRVTIRWDPDALTSGAHVAEVQVRPHGRDWTTIWVRTLGGHSPDCAPSLGSEVLSAYLWGERGDVLRACAGVQRMMMAHEREATF